MPPFISGEGLRCNLGDQLAFRVAFRTGLLHGSGPEEILLTLMRFKGPVPSKIYSKWSEVTIWSHGGQCFRSLDILIKDP